MSVVANNYINYIELIRKYTMSTFILSERVAPRAAICPSFQPHLLGFYLCVQGVFSVTVGHPLPCFLGGCFGLEALSNTGTLLA